MHVATHGGTRIDAVLSPFTRDEDLPRPLELLGWFGLCGGVQGACMGAHSGSVAQVLYSAVKVPLYLSATAILCLASFVVLNLILGLGDDLRRSLRGIATSLCTVAICLGSLAPMVLTCYASGVRYETAVALNGAVFACSSAAGQWVLVRHFRPLIERDRRHRIALCAWLTLFVLVGVQLGWVLRPFVGWPDVEPTFLRADVFSSNAYLQAIEAVRRTLGF